MKELARIQRELKAPKAQWNKFSEFSFRSAEDILEAVKPILGDCSLTLTDSLESVLEFVYVKATATLWDCDGKVIASTDAYARETPSRPKFDAAQLTGSASSYARKYALNGLFAIDDNKDADTRDNRKEGQLGPELTAGEKAAIALTEDPTLGWYEVLYPGSKAEFVGKTLSELATSEEGVKVLKSIEKAIASYVDKYPLADKNIKAAIAESKNFAQ